MKRQSTRSKPSGGTKHARKKPSARQAISRPHAAANRGSGDERPLQPLGRAGGNKEREDRGAIDERESLVNDRPCGTKYEITPKVEEVAAIHGFMNDLDCKTLDPAVVGSACVESAEAFYSRHVKLWLERDPVLAKAEVRDTGGGLHTIMWLDEPVIVAAGEAHTWDAIARGICNVLPGDPNLNGIIALTRPVGALNTKYSPPREVRLLRPGEPVTRAEILDLSRQAAEQPARLWMRMFFGGERVEPCPFCGKESLGVAGSWQVCCYTCGRINAASLVYRFYSPEFLDSRMEAHHG
jgi:hypothetical protein